MKQIDTSKRSISCSSADDILKTEPTLLDIDSPSNKVISTFGIKKYQYYKYH
jgi:hypothetical protein